MSKIAQAKEVFSVVMDRSAPATRRREALEQLAALKRAAKVSYTKMGINEEYLNEAIAMLDAEGVEDTTESQGEQETAQAEEATQSDREAKRAQIVALLQEVAEEPRREQVRRLVEDLGLTMYAAYYYARAYQPK